MKEKFNKEDKTTFDKVYFYARGISAAVILSGSQYRKTRAMKEINKKAHEIENLLVDLYKKRVTK